MSYFSFLLFINIILLLFIFKIVSIISNILILGNLVQTITITKFVYKLTNNKTDDSEGQATIEQTESENEIIKEN